jgi:lactoylglutathione lyase
MPFRDGFAILHTADLPRLVAFYVEQLGCDEAYRFEDAYVSLSGPLKLGITAVQELEPPGRAALWLYCDDVDAELERLRAAGAEVVREPADMEWGERMASIRDPDGNEIFLGAQ